MVAQQEDEPFGYVLNQSASLTLLILGFIRFFLLCGFVFTFCVLENFPSLLTGKVIFGGIFSALCLLQTVSLLFVRRQMTNPYENRAGVLRCQRFVTFSDKLTYLFTLIMLFVLWVIYYVSQKSKKGAKLNYAFSKTACLVLISLEVLFELNALVGAFAHKHPLGMPPILEPVWDQSEWMRMCRETHLYRQVGPIFLIPRGQDGDFPATYRGKKSTTTFGSKSGGSDASNSSSASNV